MKNRKKLTTMFIFMLLFSTISITAQAIYLDDLEDVIIDSVQDDQHLIFDSGTNNWTNENYVGGSDGFAGWKGHPHNQDVNITSALTVATLNTGLGNNELYDMNQNVLDSSNVEFERIYIAGTGDGDRNLHLNTGANPASIEMESTGDYCRIYFNGDDDENLFFYYQALGVTQSAFGWNAVGAVDSFQVALRYSSSWYYPFKINHNADTNMIVVDDDAVYISSSSGSAGKELDVAGDIECTSLNEVSNPLVKDFIMDLKSKPNKLRILAENLTYKLFKWNDSLFDDTTNETYNKTIKYKVGNKGYGIGINLFELAFWFNETFGNKYLSCLVTLPTENSLGSVNYINVLAVISEYNKLIVKEDVKHTKHIEEFLSNYGYIPLEWEV